ncbi:hypothetical protein ACFPPA_16685 [Rhodanobacter ginsengisoli]|uniref:Hemerythrin-like domain-containing protein n=1 Tax=Rhodanobacter ginsengisoli TaxID=418646 RepID=A0ABW0QTB1_9GAMM
MQSSSSLAVATQPAAARYNMYGFIHKALRAFMSDTLTRLGRMDVMDAEDVAASLGQTRDLLHFCRAHLEHENRFVHPALEAREPGSTRRIAGEHVHHEDDIELLLGRVDSLERLDDDATAAGAAATRLYRDMAVFAGGNFEHMDYEEREHNATLWAHYSDAELQAIEGALVASLPPETAMLSMRWMIPAISHAERVQLLGGIRANAPAEVLSGVLNLARARLDERDWSRLAAALELSPVGVA